jgi:hypothetical protein
MAEKAHEYCVLHVKNTEHEAVQALFPWIKIASRAIY